MAGFVNVDGVNMTEDEVAELIYNLEVIPYDRIDELRSDSDKLDRLMPSVASGGIQDNVQLIRNEFEEEIDINMSVNDLFIDMINNDEEEENFLILDSGSVILSFTVFNTIKSTREYGTIQSSYTANKFLAFIPFFISSYTFRH